MDPVVRDAGHSPAAGRVAWWRSLRTRLLFWSTFTSVMLLAVLAAAFYLGVRELMLDNARAQMRQLTLQATLGLAATMESVQIDAEALRIGTLQPGSDPDRWRALLQATVLADADVDGAMLVIAPGTLPAAPDGWSWYVRLDDREKLVEQTVEALGYDVPAMSWYVRTVDGDEAWWSEPYANAATAGRIFVTYNLPLRRPRAGGGHDAIGMVSLDVPLSRLRDVLGVADAPDAVKPGLLSPERALAAHPDPRVALDRTLDAVVADGRSDLQPFLDAVRARRPFEGEHVVATDGDGLTVPLSAGARRYSIARPVADTGWTVILGADDDYLLAGLARIGWAVLGLGVVGGLAGMWAMRRTTAMVAGPIESLTASARHLGDGEFERPIEHVDRPDEVGVMARVFDASRHSIRRQMAEIADLGAARERAEGELRIAGEIQQAMLPRDREFVVGDGHACIAGRLEPAKAVGGDFYNFFSLDGQSLWFAIGDVSDKGVPAALFMARTLTALEAAVRLRGAPGVALKAAARYLAENNDACMFATVLCGVLDLRDGALQLASAAHEPPLLVHADGRREFLDVPTTPPLGVDVVDDYPTWHGRLAPGDTLLAYTDGVTEAFTADDRPFGVERLLAVPLPADAPGAACGRLVDAVHAFVAGAPASDDITVLALRYDRPD
jgi:sigma-B regulation protein RsbU (phosphoserine phosphatase)